jgi:hypothetical protein
MANFTAVYDASATKQAQKSTYNPSRLDAVHSDLSPNLSPTRREALIFTPLP